MLNLKSHKTVEQIAKKHHVDVSFIKKQLKMGEPIEHEHTKDHDLAMDIALQHLDEIPDYYTRLKKMEKEAMKEENKSGDSSLHDWFSKSKSSDGKPGWVQLGGKYAGKPCAKQPGQTTKPKCGSSKMKRDLSKGEEEAAFRRKNKKDPNPERSGKAINVATEAFVDPEQGEAPSGRSPLQNVSDHPKAAVRKKAVGAFKKQMSKEYGGTWKSRTKDPVDEACWSGYKQVGMKKKGKKIVPNCVPVSEDHKEIASGKMKDEEGYMANIEFDQIERAVAMLRKRIKKGDQQIPAWVQSKITRAADFIDTAADYMASDEKISEAANPAQQAAIAIAMKKAGKKPKTMKEEEGKKDACYHKVKSRYKVWPSAYASGALVKCRKKGAKNWGTKSESTDFLSYDWDGPVKHHDKRYCPKCEKVEHYWECKYGPKYWSLFSIPEPLAPNQATYHIAKIHPANEEFSEAIKIPALYGNVLSIILTWRGKSYMAKMFFPNAKMPTRREVKDQIEKVYPGSTVLSYEVSKVQPGEPLIQVTEETIEEVAAWQRKEGKNKSGGLNEKGRKSYERENPGSDLKAPSKKVGNPRRKSFCARMKGMKKKLTSAKTANDPDSRINKSLRAWNC